MSRDEPTVYFCTGSDCRKRGNDFDRLREVLDEVRTGEMKCRKACDGAVICVEHEDDTRWFDRMDSGKARQGLLAWLEGGKLEKPLKKRRIKSLRGVKPRT